MERQHLKSNEFVLITDYLFCRQGIIYLFFYVVIQLDMVFNNSLQTVYCEYSHLFDIFIITLLKMKILFRQSMLGH